jgi:phosphoribosylglycinamide formyltransferase-1
LFKIAVLVSGGGTNLQSIIDAIKNREINVQITVVVSSTPNAYALERAKTNNIQTFVVTKKEFPNPSNRICDILDKLDIDLVVLAGYLGILKGQILSKYKIINVHPALLPKFGGVGMYGIHVHEAVISAGEKKSGCTVHYVNDKVDGGEIILQKYVDVLQDDTPETLAKRVLFQEHICLIEAIKKIMDK